jgi:hypothetical protein
MGGDWRDALPAGPIDRREFMRRRPAPALMLCASLFLAAPAAARNVAASKIIGFEGVAMTLDEMNAYFRGKSCSGDYGRKVFFGSDGSFRSVYPDSTSEGAYTFAPGVVTVRTTGGSSKWKIGRTERLRASRLPETGQHLLGFNTLFCGADAR